MAKPPVCRIMDYGKFRYEEAQKAKEARRKSIERHDQRSQVPTQDRQGRLRHQDAPPHGVHRRRTQSQGHAAVPWPRDGPPGTRSQDPRRRDHRCRPSRQGREPSSHGGPHDVDSCSLPTRRHKTPPRKQLPKPTLQPASQPTPKQQPNRSQPNRSSNRIDHGRRIRSRPTSTTTESTPTTSPPRTPSPTKSPSDAAADGDRRDIRR